MDEAPNTAYVAHAPVIGTNLFRLAHSWACNAPKTADRDAAVKLIPIAERPVIDGSRSVRTVRAALDAAASDLARERHAKRQRKPGRRRNLGARPWGPIVVIDYQSALTERALKRTRRLFAASDRMRRACSGDLRYAVLVTDDPRTVDYRSKSSEGESYTRTLWYYRRTDVSQSATIRRHWITRVYNRGLATAGDKLTLDAELVASEEPDLELYAAVWASQSRGFSVNVSRGYLARHGVVAYHAPSKGQAISGLRRKLAKVAA